MITVEEALGIVLAQVPELHPEEVRLEDAAGAYLAADVTAPYDHPLFDMSAVDGYAFRFDPVVAQWKVVDQAPAGSARSTGCPPGCCVRIFTGAQMPPDTDTVVMQEFTTRTVDIMVHSDRKLVQGGNVRRQAEQVKRGEVILRQGELLSPSAIGLLASVGVRSVPIKLAPEVAVLVTGDEFVEGDRVEPGKIFSSNGLMLEAALRVEGLLSECVHVPDEVQALDSAIEQAARFNEVVISTGGASVGDHDLVHDAVLRAGGMIHFHGVAQKPGKPMLFATVHGRPFFGLPGNPRAVLVLFYIYVLPFLRAMRGARGSGLRKERLPLAADLLLRGDRAEFRAGRLRGGAVELLAEEGSHMLRSMTEAQVIVHLPSTKRTWRTGEPVEVLHLPHHSNERLA
ncbi:MAG TPA: molybdopterin molybdotransferase MoeA [Flavobacteriales bacterium]|nr:molybdopterin molybdotransferase MoeA [Flavobacteriales bacterium]